MQIMSYKRLESKIYNHSLFTNITQNKKRIDKVFVKPFTKEYM